MTFRPVITRAGNETTAILHLLQIERTGKSRKLTAADLIPLGIDDSSKDMNQSTWKWGYEHGLEATVLEKNPLQQLRDCTNLNKSRREGKRERKKGKKEKCTGKVEFDNSL